MGKKSSLLKTLFIFLLCLVNVLCIESEESVKKRLEFSRRLTKIASNDRVDIAYTPEKGMYCVAKENIKKKTILFRVPGEYTISSFDFYPFKNEILQAIYDYVSNQKYELNPEIDIPSTIVNSIKFSHFAFHIMFYMQAPEERQKVFEFTKKMNIYKHVDMTPESFEYFQSFPLSVRMAYSIDDEEDLLFLLTKNHPTVAMKIEYAQIFNYVNNYIGFKFPEYKDYILPWIKDWNKYKLAISYIGSRAYSQSQKDFEKLRGIQIAEIIDPETYQIQQRLLNIQNNESSPGLVLIPVFDLCNHKNEKAANTFSNATNLTNKGFNLVLVANDFKKGEEISYPYSSVINNKHLLLNYGFTFESNMIRYKVLKVSFPKTQLTKEKFEIANTANFYLNSLYNNPYKTEKWEKYYNNEETRYEYETKLTPFRRNYELLNFVKMMVLPEKQDRNYFEERNRLIDESWISYNIELISRAICINRIDKVEKNFSLNSIDLMRIIQVNRDYVKINPYEEYFYREKLFSVDLEEKHIFLINERFSLHDSMHLLSDQFSKIKEHYLNKS